MLLFVEGVISAINVFAQLVAQAGRNQVVSLVWVCDLAMKSEHHLEFGRLQVCSHVLAHGASLGSIMNYD